MKTIKNLDVQDIQQQVDSTKDFISKTKESVEQVKKALNGITTLHDGFSGNTADSIRSFYEEAHKPFLEFMESFLVQYEEALSSVSDQVLSFEPNERGFIRQEFLEGELTSKMQKAQDSLSATTDMINQQLDSVCDLASVSHVKDDVFLDSIADAKKRISKTVDGMYEMDSNATSKLDKSEDDIQQMKTYVSKLRDAIDKNNITVDKYNITQFNSEFFSYHDEFKLIAKGRNALATGEKAEITAEEFNQLYPYIKNEENIIDEYYEWNGTYHTLKDGRIIREYMHDTGVSYEFVDKIPEPRSKPLSDTEEFVYGAVGGVWDFFTEDLATVLNPDATKGEKAFALAMFLPVGKPVKLITKGSGFVSDGVKSLDKLIDNKHSVKKDIKNDGIPVTKTNQEVNKDVNVSKIKSVSIGEQIISERTRKAAIDLAPKVTPYKSLSRTQQKNIKEKIDSRTATKEEYNRYQWDKRFSKRRASGVNNFWKQEKKRIKSGENTTRPWNDKQLQDILQGKKPRFNDSPIIGHHTYNAMNYPHISNRGEIIYPVTSREHLKGWHGGSYKSNAPGKPVNPNYMEEF